MRLGFLVCKNKDNNPPEAIISRIKEDAMYVKHLLLRSWPGHFKYVPVSPKNTCLVQYCWCAFQSGNYPQQTRVLISVPRFGVWPLSSRLRKRVMLSCRWLRRQRLVTGLPLLCSPPGISSPSSSGMGGQGDLGEGLSGRGV